MSAHVKSADRYIVGVTAECEYVVLQVVRAPIGPFPDLEAAQAAAERFQAQAERAFDGRGAHP